MINGFYYPAKLGKVPPPPDEEETGGGGTPPNPPSWAIGTWYAVDSNGVPATLIINANGSVSFSYQGNHTGLIFGTVFSVDTFGQHTISQTATGIRTSSNYGTTDYTHTQPTTGGGNTGGGSNPCNGVTCPAGTVLSTLGGNCTCINTICAADIKTCANGSTVKRNPENNCQFFDCPTSGGNTGGGNDNNNGSIDDLINNPVQWVQDNKTTALAIGGGLVLLLLLSKG